MLEEINTIIKTLWQLGAEPLLISLQIKDYYDFCLELSETTGDRMIYTTINSYLNVKIYKNIDVPESVMLAEYGGFLMQWPINGNTILLIESGNLKNISKTMQIYDTNRWVDKQTENLPKCIICGKPVPQDVADQQHKSSYPGGMWFAGTYCSEHNPIGKMQPPDAVYFKNKLSYLMDTRNSRLLGTHKPLETTDTYKP